jgi:hypothetical protein
MYNTEDGSSEQPVFRSPLFYTEIMYNASSQGADMDTEPQKYRIEVRITLVLPFVIRLNDACYHGKVEGNQFNLHLKYCIKNPAKESDKESIVAFKLTTGELDEASNIKVPGALLQYSMAQVQFWRNVEFDSAEAQQGSIQKCLDRAFLYLNRFIDIYRYSTSDTEVRPLTKTEYYATRANHPLHFWINCQEKRKLLMGNSFGEAGVSTLPPLFGDNIRNTIDEMFKSGEQPPITDLLLLNARTYIENGEFRLAIVELGSALDIRVEQITKSFLEQGNKLTEENKKKLENLPTKQIVEQLLNPVLKENIMESAVWMEIDNKFRKLRNAVIHDAYNPTKLQSSEALQLVQSFFELLNKLTVDALPSDE